ncbi:14766_t:CDS:2, partial [Gigaspora margarita]
PRKGETVKILYDPDKGSKAICMGLKMLQEDGSHVLSRVYFGQMDKKQRQDDFADINATWSGLDCVVYTSTVEAGISFEISNHFDTVIGISNINTEVYAEAFAQMFYRVRDCPYHIISLYNSKKTSIFKEPNRDLIHAELSALRPRDLPTAIKGYREWNKIADCYTLDSSPAVETYIEVEYQRRLSAKYFPGILCSLIASTGATLELISAEDAEKVNRNKVSHTIKNIKKTIKCEDVESIANAPDITPYEAEILKQNPIRSFTNNMTLQQHYLWKVYASGDIRGKDDIRNWGMNNDDWVKLCDIDFVKRYNNPEPLKHFRRLAYYRRQGFNTTNSIENLKIKEKMQWEDSYNSVDPSSVDLHKFYSAKQWEAVHNLVQSIGFSDIDDMNVLFGDDVAKTFEQSQEKIIKIREDALLLFGFKTRAKGLPDLNATIKFINAVIGSWCGYTIKSSATCVGSKGYQIWKKTYWIDRNPYGGAGFNNQEEVMARKLDNPEYCPIAPDLFDSMPITTDIAISKFSNEVCEKSSCNSIVEKSVTDLPQLNESNIDTIIFYLQEKFQISKEKLEQWRAKIAFEMWDNHNYWKKECESMDEITFLDKRNFEAKMKVPTTPYKKELKNKSLAIIEYT